jgi:hypothetical protein
LYEAGLSLDISEDDAAKSLCSYLAIDSRSELKSNEAARKKFDDLRRMFVEG